MLILLIIGLSLLLTFYFAGTETAFISVNRVRIELWRRQKRRGSEVIADFLMHPERFIYTTLVGNNIANVALASYATLYLHRYLDEKITWLIITFVTILFGEIIPKTLFRSMADWIILKVGPLLQTFYYLLLPFIWLVSRVSNLILRLFPGEDEEMADFFSRKDVEILIREIEGRSNINKRESEILSRVLHLRELKVRDAMIPRTEIVAVEDTVSIKELIRVFQESGFTKIPVYHENLDNIIGVIFLKDLFTEPNSISEIIRDVLFVPETKNGSELLREFRANNTSIAIVIDEYGGTAGLVTTEDLLEELVGEIEDEFDETEVMIRQISERTYSVNARIEPEELEEKLGIQLPEGDYETLAGFILNYLGHIPRRDETFEYKGIKFVVTKATRRKLEWVRVHLPEGHPVPRTGRKKIS